MPYLFLMHEDYKIKPVGHIFYTRLLHNLSCWSETGYLQTATHVQATLDVSVLADVGLQAFCLWEEEGEEHTVV